MKTFIISIFALGSIQLYGLDTVTLKSPVVTITIFEANQETKDGNIRTYNHPDTSFSYGKEVMIYVGDSLKLDTNYNKKVTVINNETKNRKFNQGKRITFRDSHKIKTDVDSIIASTENDITRPAISDFEFNIRPSIKAQMKEPDINLGRTKHWLDATNKPSTIRNLEIYPNNPDNDYLNVSFNASEKGNIRIELTDVDGNQLAIENIKDFQGKYIGQINAGKNFKGTVFVKVTQNGDGSVKRIVLK